MYCRECGHLGSAHSLSQGCSACNCTETGEM